MKGISMSLSDHPLSSTEDTQRQLENLDRLAKNFGQSMQNAFSRSTLSSKSFDSSLRSLSQSLSKMAERSLTQLAGKGLGLLFGNLVGSPLGGGGLFGSSPFAGITPFASGGVVASPSYFPLGKGLGLMGESGAEAIMPLARGPDGKLGVRGGGHTTSVVVNISTPDASSFKKSESQVSAAIAKAVVRGQRGL